MTQNPRTQASTETPAMPMPSNLPEPISSVSNPEPSQESTPVTTSDPAPSSLLASKTRLRIHFEDVTHPAVTTFATNVPLGTILQTAVSNVEKCLFTPPSASSDHFNSASLRPTPPPHWKPQDVRAITLFLRPIDGVAYTTGTDLDESHKEIHMSLNYVDDIKNKYTSSATHPHSPLQSSVRFDAKSFIHEMCGVITHEMVHCFQHNGSGTCPGGLIEGIADYVRMEAGLGALHWRKFPANKETRGEKWDEGYQKTAWFLEWVEQEIGGMGSIGKLNERMRTEEWRDGKVWEKVMNGVTVEECWEAYRHAWEGMKEGGLQL